MKTVLTEKLLNTPQYVLGGIAGGLIVLLFAGGYFYHLQNSTPTSHVKLADAVASPSDSPTPVDSPTPTPSDVPSPTPVASSAPAPAPAPAPVQTPAPKAAPIFPAPVSKLVFTEDYANTGVHTSPAYVQDSDHQVIHYSVQCIEEQTVVFTVSGPDSQSWSVKLASGQSIAPTTPIDFAGTPGGTYVVTVTTGTDHFCAFEVFVSA